MGKITIKNVSTANVILSIPEIAFRRELSPGREIGITEQEYNDIMFDPGVTTLVRDHYIQINGVEEDQQVEEVGQVFDKDVISKMLDKQDITAFAKFIPNAQPAEKDRLQKQGGAKDGLPFRSLKIHIKSNRLFSDGIEPAFVIY